MFAKGFGIAAGLVALFAASAASARADAGRSVQEAVDSYLNGSSGDTALVGGPGSAGYDDGFWIRGGQFLLRINLTLQARFESFDWVDVADEPAPGGDLSGYSLPRATLKLSGEAPCCIRYYAELEFGHAARVIEEEGMMAMGMAMPMALSGDVGFPADPGILREGWIEWGRCPAFNVRMGLVKIANTRQLMTPPEMQQFVDVSMAAASVGAMLPGYTDRNRDYGVAIHGELGRNGSLSYLLTITNGDGSVHRNVLDNTTNDNLAYSARVNWDFLGHVGYEECALRQRCGQWVGSVGAWGFVYEDVVMDKPHETMGRMLDLGVDLALGYGGFSFCAAFTYGETKDGDPMFEDMTSTCACVQAGYLFPGTAWEVAARYSTIWMKMGSGAMEMKDAAHEFGFAVNYFLDGHRDKLTADVSFITADGDENTFSDVYTAYHSTGTGDGILLRFQWQLAL